MSEHKQVSKQIDVPLDAGIEGFILAVRRVLCLSRVVDIQINQKGQITYRRWVTDGELDEPINVDFESVTPMGVIRTTDIVDLGVVQPTGSPSEELLSVLRRIDVDRFYPVCYVVGTNSVFFSWLGVDPPRPSELGGYSTLFGLPLYVDQQVETDTLLVCASYGRAAALIDARVTYKLSLPQVNELHGVNHEDVGSSDQGGPNPSDYADGVPALGRPDLRPGGTRAEIDVADLLGGGSQFTRPGG